MSQINIADQVVEKINGEKIAPHTVGYFYARRSVIFAVAGIAVMTGALAMATSIHNISGADWKFFRAGGGSVWSYIGASLPFVWLFFLLLFGLISFLNFRQFKTGYKYPLLIVLAAYVGLTFLLGVGLWRLGVGHFVENKVAAGVPVYRNMACAQARMWSHPENGTLSGQVMELGDEVIVLNDWLTMDKWRVLVNSSTKFYAMNNLQLGDKIKIIGIAQDGRIFVAGEIAPFQTGCSCGCNGGMKKHGTCGGK
ncbi:MAG TPA: hypothetical protein PLV72_01750 [Candidatus Magasanikbacteria bacterium]|nr:hypothetical protein [Candidatus Magasanikbacteria bacterium]